MAFSPEDRTWMDNQFNRIHERIDKHVERIEDRMNIHSTKINAVSIGSLQAVSSHEKDHHDPVKKWTLWGTIIGIASAVGAGLSWAFRLHNKE